LNKGQLVEEIAGRTGIAPRDVAQVVDAFLEIVKRTVVRGDKVVLSGFGTFHRRSRARRVARDIGAGRRLVVPATTVPAFRPGKPFREAVARRRGQPRARTRKAPARVARRLDNK
jgi:DNA-binding protein HU-beta